MSDARDTLDSLVDAEIAVSGRDARAQLDFAYELTDALARTIAAAACGDSITASRILDVLSIRLSQDLDAHVAAGPRTRGALV